MNAEPQYDVFLSYNSNDGSAVEQIAVCLSNQGIRSYLDRWYLVPGLRWRPKLEQALSQCKAVAVFVGPEGLGPWQQREVDVALDRQRTDEGFPVIPVLLSGCDPPLGFLRQVTWVDLRKGEQQRQLLVLSRAIRGQPPEDILQQQSSTTRADVCPYRGLLHFREEDAPFFFGRSAASRQLTAMVHQHRFVAVVGASGTGKSSLVRAGLLPHLRTDSGMGWEIITLLPGTDPFRSLAGALLPKLEPTMTETDYLAEATKLARHLIDGTISASAIVQRVIEKQPGTERLLILVDQWEELYTMLQTESVRLHFIDELLASTERAPCSVVLTLRGDFVGAALAYRPLSDRFQGAQLNLGPMTKEELREAIIQPALQVSLDFEPGLVERIVQDACSQPGHLPLLEFVLRRLWENRERGRLLHTSYDSIGGLEGSIANEAERIFLKLSSPQKEAAMRLFVSLVHIGEGAPDTLKRQRLRDIPGIDHALLSTLTKERLLVGSRSEVGGDDTIELAHEALIRRWDRLRLHVEKSRESIIWHQRLQVMRLAWLDYGRDATGLLHGVWLEVALDQLSQQATEFSTEELDFIFRSSNDHAAQQFDKDVERTIETVPAQLEALENREVIHDPAPLLRREKTRWQTLLRHRAQWAAKKALLQRARRKKHPRRELVLAPALRAFLLCLLIGGSGVGYIWQKDQLRQLDLLVQGRQTRLNGLVQSNTALERLLVEQFREVQTKQLTNRDAPKK